MPTEPSSFFVDTNVLLYLRDRREPEKRATATTWIATLEAQSRIVISPQVINEYCSVTLTKLDASSRLRLHDTVQGLARWCTAETSVATAMRALDLQQRMHVRFYDAVLLASALTAGCACFLSEDLQHDRHIDDMRIVNPFLVAPDMVLANRT